MFKYIYLTLAFICISCKWTWGQNLSNSIWCFGYSEEISFLSGAPVFVPGCALSALEGTSVVCNRTTGQLLFYTDGVNVWNRNNTIMPGNTIPLGGSSSSTESAFTVPMPGSADKYYVFTTDAQVGYYGNGDSGLSYSVIDMTLDGGLGDVALQPRLLLKPTTEKLTATPMANGTGFWVLTHLWNSDAFYAYPITQAGIGTPVISHIGAVHKDGGLMVNNESIGCMSISPDGTMLAAAIAPTVSKVELFSFDNATGKLTGMIFSDDYTWNDKGWGPYGISFSPNSKVLYATYQRGDSATNYVIQYDLSLLSGQAMIGARDTFFVGGQYVGAAKIAPDGKIYIAVASLTSNRTLEGISNPNVIGPGCNYRQNAFTFPSGHMILGLPNGLDIAPYLADSLIVVKTNCSDSCGASVVARAISGYPPYSYQWSNGVQNDSVAANLCPGKYYVVIHDIYGSSVTDSITISASHASAVNITVTSNILSCNNAGSLQWYLNDIAIPGATGATYVATSPGIYTVAGSDSSGCKFSEILTVDGPGYFFPNVFTPNNDGVNDLFYPALQPGAALVSFRIFDRWGELIYDDATKPWDGKFKGVAEPPAVYVYNAEIQTYAGNPLNQKNKRVYHIDQVNWPICHCNRNLLWVIIPGIYHPLKSDFHIF